MKLCTFNINQHQSYGLVLGEGIVDLGTRLPDPDLRALIASGDMARAEQFHDTPTDYPLSDVTFAPVTPNPDKIIYVGLNYRDHVDETGNAET